jgi:hypothetical protein
VSVKRACYIQYTMFVVVCDSKCTKAGCRAGGNCTKCVDGYVPDTSNKTCLSKYLGIKVIFRSIISTIIIILIIHIFLIVIIIIIIFIITVSINVMSEIICETDNSTSVTVTVS